MRSNCCSMVISLVMDPNTATHEFAWNNGFLNLQVRSDCCSMAILLVMDPNTATHEFGLLSSFGTSFQKSNIQSLCKDIPQSARKGRTPNLREHKLRDRPSPLGPHGKNHNTACEDALPNVHEQQSAIELLSLSSRPPCSVEDGEEVNQVAGSPSIHSRSPIRAPLGISFNAKGTRRVLWNGLESASETCYCRGELPHSSSLRKRSEQKLGFEGLSISVDCADVLNNSLDVFMKRLIKLCL
ncbi:hypothetical protein V6N13_043931 [Hibiscus sabdariffa]